jgi:succinoglycan biosynthesis protein ExoA
MIIGTDQAQRATAPVLVVIPCLNEERHIEPLVARLLREADRIPMRIVVADGGSTDATRVIAARLAEADGRVVLMDNPERIQAAAVNNAVRSFGSGVDYLIRIDAHASYPDDYCEQLLRVQARTRADSVVVTMRTEGHTCFERAAAAAQNSVLGNGGAAHRNETGGRWVEHGHHALMTIPAFTAVGGYDETFSHNEDAELDARLTAADYRIYLTGETSVTYYPRNSPAALFRQYYNIGRGRARNFLRHRNLRARHLVLVSVAPVAALVLLAPVWPILALPGMLWAAACLGYGAWLGVRLEDPCAAAAGVAAMATQLGWSCGFFAGLTTLVQGESGARFGTKAAAKSPVR